MPDQNRSDVGADATRLSTVVTTALFFWIGACSNPSNGARDAGGGASGSTGVMLGAGGLNGASDGGTTGTGGLTPGAGGSGTGGAAPAVCHVISTESGGTYGQGGAAGDANGDPSGAGGVTSAPLYDGGIAALNGTYHCTAGRYLSDSCFALREWDIVIDGNEARFALPSEALYDRSEAVCDGQWTGAQLDCCSIWMRNGRYCDTTIRLRFISANELVFWRGLPEPTVDYSARCIR